MAGGGAGETRCRDGCLVELGWRLANFCHDRWKQAGRGSEMGRAGQRVRRNLSRLWHRCLSLQGRRPSRGGHMALHGGHFECDHDE